RAAFDKPNEVLYEATRGIADIITITGIINVDFADVRTVMKESGQALMGCGIASGENRAVEAAQKAISSPLLEGVSIKGAKNILLNVTGSANMTMQEIEEGNKVIYEAAGEEANIIFGLVSKEEMTEYISYTVIATGFGSEPGLNGLSTIKKAKEEKPVQKKAANVGGFHKNKFEFDNSDDLSVPTIWRVKRGDPDLFLSNDSRIESGFRNEAKLLSDEEDYLNRTRDEEDSSSFLRKIMD
ncbi:MAG: cell division protein FtsZ, partial [Bacteroidota bacterium]